MHRSKKETFDLDALDAIHMPSWSQQIYEQVWDLQKYHQWAVVWISYTWSELISSLHPAQA